MGKRYHQFSVKKKVEIFYIVLITILLVTSCSYNRFIHKEVTPSVSEKGFSATPTEQDNDVTLDVVPTKTKDIHAHSSTISPKATLNPTVVSVEVTREEEKNIPWPIAYSNNYNGIHLYSQTDNKVIRLDENQDFIYSSPSWSPDGKFITYSIGSAGIPESIYIVNIDNQLHEEVGYGYHPVWSPYGLELTFSSRDGDLYSYSVETKKVTAITLTPNVIELNPAWSWDGKWLAYLSYSINGSNQREIMLFSPSQNMSKSIKMNITPGDGKISWSPDNTKIVFRSIEGCGKICVANVNNAETECLTSSSDGGRDPSWSPDGKWIAFSLTTDTRYCDQKTLESLSVPWRLFLMKTDGNDLQPFALNNRESIITGAAWSPVTPLSIQTEYQITPLGNNLNLREGSSINSKIIKTLSVGDIIIPLDGPSSVDMYRWWKVLDKKSGIEGWIVEEPGWFYPLVKFP